MLTLTQPGGSPEKAAPTWQFACHNLSIVKVIAILLFGLTASIWSADPPPPPPSKTTGVGASVTNPITGLTTTVHSIIVDPSISATPNAVAFVRTADNHVFLVKEVGEFVYNTDNPPLAFKILAKDTTTKEVELEAQTTPASTETAMLSYQLTLADFQSEFLGADGAGVTTPDIVSGTPTGVRNVLTGAGGSNGRSGALFVPPNSGGHGQAGPASSYTTSFHIDTINQIGLEVGSVGGRGGNGGNSYASFWKGRSGGNGGAGGPVTAINGLTIQIATTGNEKHGIYAYSRSGQGGSGGSGYAAPGGGAGGHANNGGNVTVENRGRIFTEGDGAFGIYALSVSNNGGGGGDTWGLVGQSGSGSHGGNGGTVNVTNSGEIRTSGDLAHGILAQSIGGSGGSSGTSGNLVLSLVGKADDGGSGGQVTVTNSGLISTTGEGSRGIYAQSIGGGGGSGGSAGGLVALGGAGSTGGSAGAVTVRNQLTGRILTDGISSDGIFAQSVGGSGGIGSGAGGFVSIGGSGATAGNGGVVTVENLGTISTTKNFARGIVAQSIGGGGGDGGSSGGLLSVGGRGAGGGTGALVTVTNGGLIETAGNDAFGILAQSIGGGGGNGGGSVSVSTLVGVAVGGAGGTGGSGGNVNVTLQGQDANTASLINTVGDRSIALFAQSVGGGGGNGGSAVQVTASGGASASFAIGGRGGVAGNGGLVTLNKGTGISIIETNGDDSTGVFLQSVGGGGGNGGYAISVAASGGPVAGSLSVGIGGDGGAAGTGGRVTVGSFAGNGSLIDTGFNGTILTTGHRSTGFLAQSVGGGGGNGGLAVAASLSASPTVSGSISVGLGGKGGAGGTGGNVQVGLGGNITTEGNSSTALLVQSVGGGGGNGGGSIAAALALGAGSGSVGVTLGGAGGSGSAGGDVNVATTAGNIKTIGMSSTGILIQSVGGGGGNGGYAISAGAAVGAIGAGSVTVGLGGDAGNGGQGGNVTANLQSNVETSSVKRALDPATNQPIPEDYMSDSTGVLVQSVGGGGGNGGFSISAGGAAAGTGSGAVTVGLGGNAGAGGYGGIVNVTSTGTITTNGDRSAGLVAQSIGGGGGNGGYNISVAGSGASVGSGAISVGLGGRGGSGNYAQSVTVHTSIGTISTGGSDSIGILAQSIGGGGGNGGYNVTVAGSAAGTGSGAITVGLGGQGGTGANAGAVNLTVNNDVVTAGKNSAAVVAQSIGGGGGSGGYNVSASGSAAGTGSGAISVGLGGNGAGGGNGGIVTALVTGNVETKEENSAGIMAQSIGGGGGNGGYNVSLSASGAGTGSGAIAVGLGGQGGAGGNGVLVDLTSRGTITTRASNSIAFIAQSIGGGGGNGGFNVSATLSGAGTASGAVSVGLGGSGAGGGHGGAVIANTSGHIYTEGDKSGGILAQSIGGGGGNGGFNVSVAGSGSTNSSGAVSVGLGGSGAAGGNASTVDLIVNNNVTTLGAKSTAIIAQSVGGGGGNGGFDITAPISAATNLSGAIGVGLGGSGGLGGNAEAVETNVTGTVTTTKAGSGGILAQSLGGGGGNGGMSITGSMSFSGSGSGAVSVGLGGSGGGGGNAGTVTSVFTGNVYTQEVDSFGIIAQSLGGGGGTGGMSISGAISMSKSAAGALAFGLGGSGGSGGYADEVNNTVTGFVQTLKDRSTGVLAQSMGGGGGNGGLNVTGMITAAKEGSGGLAIGIGGLGGDGGDGKKVTNTVTGGVITAGDKSAAIVAQSLGGGGGNGGINVTGSLNVTKDGGGTLGIGIGGFGGNGGDGGDVTSTIRTTTTHNQIGTVGDESSAIVAQSLGGGGGNGGLNVTGAVNITGKNGAAIGVGLGGFGGGAGNGGTVIVDAKGEIVTQGNLSHGILAQSVGGGGGNGATNVSGTLAFTQNPSTTAAVSLGVGGFGGGGGTGGTVRVDYEGTLSARPSVYVPATSTQPARVDYVDGAGSHGIAAQSIGGGGGNGGLNVSGGVAYEGGTGSGYGIIAGVGGFGGLGGNAGSSTVNVTGGGSITGYGSGHSAILAQSIGGGGGAGGMNISGGITSDSALLVGVGGFGANGGTGGEVKVTATTNVFASAFDSKNFSSAGVMAQSIGGGGGNGGLNVTGGLAISKQASVPSVNLGIGGFGGSGAISGNVEVNLTGNATTSGDWVHGIMAQSIAGGGGNGAINAGGQFNFADSENSGGKTDISIIAGVGGNAGDGANAGNVVVTNSGTISTSGNYARGVAAQSIGGGGGTGGMNVTAIYTKSSNPITVGVGGSGGGGGHAGTVTVSRGSLTLAAGGITTDGIKAYGIEASSIGGGGGDAGMNFNVGYSKVGEGTATAGFAANFVIGGSGAIAGNGSVARVTNFSSIETKQERAYGILAQSIGGGGGNGNFNIGVTHAGASDSAGDKLYNKPNQNMAFSLGVGGATGDGGDGDLVVVNQTGNITTLGKDAIGILAQSVGGGGGNAGLDIAAVKADGGKVGITLGRTGGKGGIGGTVELTYSGTLNTTGNGAFGLLAQSIGNGGGNSSSTTISAEVPSDQTDLGETRSQSASLAIGMDGGEGGLGGMVTLDSAGFITTRGTRAHAVFAQSIGGGGGNGGKANTFGISAAIASVTLGGTGGFGGTGGIVNLTNTAQVQTFGEEAVGLLAQSIGGGGGNGGSTFAGGTKTGDTGINIGIGGVGGSGMTGGDVTAINRGIVVTHGLAAHALLAQSIGGGGGDGGMAMNMIMGLNTASPNANSSTRVAVNVGGNGGSGGDGGTVNVLNTGGIGTHSAASVGIFAQSIGGGGGNGRSVLTSSISGTGGNNLSVSIGGSGGTGGTGGTVIVKNQKTADPDSGKIITLGDQAHGILAMSVGGGGGNGSSVSTINRSDKVTGPSSAQQFGMSIGGNGGSGGTGGRVEVVNDGSIATGGKGAHGIIAQSIGGGGGNGGMATSGDLAFGSEASPANGKTFQIAVGGQGGSGNKGGDVEVTNSGSIHVTGEKSYGIYAQSVGGGGGDGGFAASFSRNLLKNPKGNFLASASTFALGGFGGTGGDGGNVTVKHSGSIIAGGDNAYGIFAQSVSGGGGNSAMSISSPVWMASNFALNSIIGGTGSSGTTGTVTIETTGTISITGKNSIAQFAQSVNGGGGNVNQFLNFSEQAAELGNNNLPLPGNGGAVDTALAFVESIVQVGADAVTGAVGSLLDATHLGGLYTSGDNSNAGLLQSIGGGGGRGTQDITVAEGSKINLIAQLGGSDVSDSHGGDVKYNQTGAVGTTGDQSTGIGIQSIGGGGGTLFVNLRTVPEPVSTLMAPMALPAPPPPATLTLGGTGGGNNNGGVVDVDFDGAAATTTGDRSNAMLIQSIGGGGGEFFIIGASGLNVDIGGNGTSGNGGNVIVDNVRAVQTNGVLSNGVVVQSIGGGGGAAFTDLDPSLIAVTFNTNNTGSGGDITFNQTGDVFVLGPRSVALILQSLGGGGGIVDDMFAGNAGGVGNSGTIKLKIDGHVIASGDNGSGVFAQSKSTGTQGNIEVELVAGKNLVFGTGGKGVHFSGGANNLFTNNGAVAGMENAAGLAFLGEDGNDVIQNNGAFMGSANFGAGVNQFNNAAAAVLAIGPQFLLGAANNLLINDGAMRPGGTGLAQRTDMTGSFVQSGTGTTFAELDFGTKMIDQVFMNGTASLAGKVNVALLNPQLVPFGSFQQVLVHADGGVTNNGMVLETAPSVVINYSVNYPTGFDAVLNYSVNFNPPDANLGRNLLEVGGYFNSIQSAGSSPALAETIIRLLYEPTMDGYRSLLSQLGPDFYGEHQAEMLRGSQRFGETALGGGNRYFDQGRMIWFDFVNSDTLHDSYDDYKTTQLQTLGFSLGFESLISQRWSAGLSFSLEENRANGYSGLWTGEGTSQRIGGVIRYRAEDTEIAGMVSYGWNQMDSSRLGQVTTPFDTNVSRDIEAFTAMLRFSHDFGDEDFSITPRVDLGVTHLTMREATEAGAGATSLNLVDNQENHAWVRPAITIRKAIPIFRDSAKLRFHAEAGYQYYLTGNDTYVRASFVGAPGGVDPMNVPIDLGSMATLSIGAQLLLANDLSIGIYYTRAFSQKYKLDLWNVRVAKDF